MSLNDTTPALSFNPSGVTDWGSSSPFIDLARVMRPLFVHTTEWAGYDNSELEAMGALDANGYPTTIPAGGTKAGTIWAWDANSPGADFRKGTYIFTYEGQADFTVNGANIISHENGRIVLENVTGGGLSIEWNNFTPATHPHDFHLVKAENEGLFNAGAMFDPAYVSIIQDARDLRFMDWMQTNNSQLSEWNDRATLDTATWSGPAGVPVEVMVRLANETGVNPWFNIPLHATEQWITNFATYVRDNLDPGLEARFEFSNEHWNWAFSQTHEIGQMAQAEWGTDRWYDYAAMLATKAAVIIDDVFDAGTAPHAQAINVLATHPANSWITEQMLVSQSWQSNDPTGYVSPASVFDEIATTTYFGGSVVTDETFLNQLRAQIAANPAAAMTWLHDQLLDPTVESSIPQIATMLAAQAQVAHNAGMKLVAYEGGQHVHHSFATQLTPAEAEELSGWMADFVRSPQMADLYSELSDVWSAHGDGAFMQFGDVGEPSRWGSWSIYSHMNDSNPRATVLFDEIANKAPWWTGATSGSQYLNGGNFVGTSANDTVQGTDQEDNLAGMAGDDSFSVGLGRDRISGGAGNDTLHIAGSSTQHILVQNPDGSYTLTGTTGHKTFVGIESVSFSNNVTVTVDGQSDQSGGGSTPPTPTGFDGDLINGAWKTVTVGDRGEGVFIQALNMWGAVAGAAGYTDKPVYAVYTANQQAAADNGSTVTVNYFSLNDGTIDMGQPLIASTPLEGALRLADIHVNTSKIVGTAYDDVVLGRELAEVVDGAGGNDYMGGGGGNDKLYGGAGNDQMMGDVGNDQLHGGAGDDTLQGGDGNDQIWAGAGSDVIDGGAGTDWAHWSDATTGVVVNLLTGAAGGGAAGDTFTGIERVSGSNLADTITGNNAANQIKGAAGNDVLIGEGGNDVLLGGAGGDTLNGGAGNDSANWSDATAAVGVNLTTGATSGWAAGDVLVSIENLTGSKYDDQLVGSSGNNTLDGGAGNDILTGAGGNDYLVGGAGADTFIFSGTNNGADRIKDFAADDFLDLAQPAGATWSDSSAGLLLTHANGTVLLMGLHQADLSWIDWG